MNFPALRTTQRQQHAVTPRLQHAVRLLQLSSLDFAQEVQEAMGRNPFLEVEEPSGDTTPADGAAASPEAD
ncbi:MAG: RNA polymerase factor sigma-54, partial [Caldimonas sp.]